jgi:enoyl-CoA hydratase
MDGAQHIKVTVNDTTGVALVLLDRPEKRNAFSQAMIGDLAKALARLDVLDTVRAAVITGGENGPFCGVFPLSCFLCQAWCSIWLLSNCPHNLRLGKVD